MQVFKSKCAFYDHASEWHGLGINSIVLEETSSVLDDAWALCGQGKFPIWSNVLAGSQRAGRGQTRREWQSPKGNLYAALHLPNVYPFNSTAAAPALSTLIIEVLNELGCFLQVKWPNDLIDATKMQKVGGILLEEKQNVIIAGIGINIEFAPSLEFMRKEAAFAAGTLPLPSDIENKLIKYNTDAVCNNSFFAERLWLYLVRKMYFCYTSELSQVWAKSWLQKANDTLLWKGHNVCLTDGNSKVCGTLSALGPQGELELLVNGQKKYFLNGSLNSF